MDRPNVLFVVWDACRLDAARSAAPNLRELAEDNLWFENAIAPAGTSLPSHVSMFTGTYPHQHETYKQTHQIGALPVLEELGKMGYERYGVSANGFASAKYGFAEAFDEFYNTHGVTIYPDGLDVHGYARRAETEAGASVTAGSVGYRRLLQALSTHEHPIKSALNVMAAGLSHAVIQHPRLSSIPHPRFSQYNEFSYDPNQNTAWLSKIFEREAESGRSFFAFTNYMDAHHPYTPPEQFQREYCGRTFSYRELDRLAEKTHPLNFMDRLKEGQSLSESALETARNLYTGEVRTADKHLGRLLEALEQFGLREDTIIVLTADHGENLGETNEMDETRIGHVCSASDHHLRVPLVVAHPELDGRTVETPVSLKDVPPLFVDGVDRLIESNGRDLGRLAPDDGLVAGEVAASATSVLEERYPALREELRRHLSVVYTKEWKVVLGSNGAAFAVTDGEPRRLEDAPDELLERCRAHLEALEHDEKEGRELSDEDLSHLEALGYL